MTRYTLLFLTIFALLTTDALADEQTVKPAPYEGEKSQLDIYLLIGQSNMAGRAAIEECDKLPIDRFYLLNGDDRFEQATHPLNQYSTIRKDIGMQRLNLGDTFARTMLETMPKDRSIGLVVNPRGGTRIEEWAVGTKYYDEIIRRAKAAGEQGTIRGVLWHQGEGNSSDEKYLGKLTSLVTRLRNDLDMPELPFVVGEINRAKGDSEVNRQLNRLPETLDHTACASSEGLKIFDTAHFDSKSLREFGSRYANKMLELQRSSKEK